MEKLHHELLIVQVFNAIFGPFIARIGEALGFHLDPAHAVPDYMVMAILILAFMTIVSLVARARLSVEHPGRLQILLEDVVGFFTALLTDYIGPKGPRYLPIVGSVGVFILLANLIGLVPGLMAPTSSINVTLGCALTVWCYYHWQGVREQGVWGYFKHFAVMPGVPLLMAPLMFVIEVISHLSRVLSLSLRLFGNIFGEELVILILFTIIPFLVPLPMMFLGIITGTLQAFIFVMLTTIYLSGAVATEHHHEAEHAH